MIRGYVLASIFFSSRGVRRSSSILSPEEMNSFLTPSMAAISSSRSRKRSSSIFRLVTGLWIETIAFFTCSYGTVGTIQIGRWSAKIADGAAKIVHLGNAPAFLTDRFSAAGDDGRPLVPGDRTKRAISGTAANDGH